MTRSIDNGNDDGMCFHKLCCFEMCQIWVEFHTCNLQLVSIYSAEVQNLCVMLNVHDFDLWKCSWTLPRKEGGLGLFYPLVRVERLW